MAQMGFFVDATRCTGCRTCQIACKDKNRLDTGIVFRHVKSYSVGDFPDVRGFNLSLSCNHCENPACAAACPTGATFKTPEGPVLHDDEICIGCENCARACPYGHPKLILELGIVHKCDTCWAIRKAGGNTVCVDACPMRALDFGDVDMLREKYGDGLVNEIPVMPKASITNPNVRIKTKDCMWDETAEELWL